MTNFDDAPAYAREYWRVLADDPNAQPQQVGTVTAGQDREVPVMQPRSDVEAARAQAAAVAEARLGVVRAFGGES